MGCHMCKYYYRGGLCANSSIQSPLCMGEGSCPVNDNGKMKETQVSNTMTVTCVSKTDTEKWLGLYCSTYKRFHCTGEGECLTGTCANADEYMKHLAERRGGIA